MRGCPRCTTVRGRWRNLLVVFAVLLPVTSSGQQLNIDRVRAMAARIAQLNTKGITDLKRFDVLDGGQLRACVEGHRHDLDEAKALMERARDLALPTQYRNDLIRAADGAFWCLSCAAHQRGCDQAAHALASIQKLMSPEHSVPDAQAPPG